MDKLRKYGLLWLLGCWPGGLFAATTYLPSGYSKLDESWRWTELEALLPYTVRDVSEAPDGKLWFGVFGGIVEYDGQTAELHRLTDHGFNEGSVTDVMVSSKGIVYTLCNEFFGKYENGTWKELYPIQNFGIGTHHMDEAADGSIWIGLRDGLYRLVGDSLLAVDFHLDLIGNLLVDSQNRLWLSSSSKGLIVCLKLDPGSGSLLGEELRLTFEPFGYPDFATLAEGQNGRIWIATNSKSAALRVVTGDQVSVVRKSWDVLQAAKVEMIIERPDNKLLIFARGELLVHADGVWKKRNTRRYSSDFPFAIQLKVDRLVLGGRNDSVNIVDLSDRRWKTFPNLNYQCQDVSGAQWFLSFDKRVVRHYPLTDSWMSFGIEDGLIGKPNSILATSDGLVWVSGSHGEDAAVSWLMDGEWHRQTHPEFSRMLSHQGALEGLDGYVYFGSNMEEKNSEGRSGGLLRYRNMCDSVEYRYLKPPDVPPRITSLVQTRDHALWFTGRTLTRKSADEPLEVINSFNDEWPASLVVDREDVLWVGNWRSGLFKRQGNHWVDVLDLGMKSKFGVVSLLSSSRSQSIWAATIDGLSRFDGKSWSHRDLVPNLKIQRKGTKLLESPDGALWINQASRNWNYNIGQAVNEAGHEFKAIRYLPDPDPPETFLHSFESRVPEFGTMHLSWTGEDPWSVTKKSELKYSYRINGEDWTPFSSRAEAVLHSMPAGNFTLEVRTRDADWNIDPSPAVAQFTVVPVLWKRPWFLMMMSLTVSAMVTLIAMMVRMRIRHLVALEEFKIDFFSRVSHELRTPLSVIIGPLQSLLKTANRAQKEPLEMAYRNARRMQGLVDKLLEFRKVELSKLSYEPVCSDLEYFIKDLVYAHSVLWEEKNQTFELILSDVGSERCFDPEMLQHILSNLLSNAIKYTPASGSVQVKATIDQLNRDRVTDNLRITVTDNGVGINPSEKDNIFDPFYRQDGAKRLSKGTGLGLAYTYELVSLWGGEISVESPVELVKGRHCGSRFMVVLPLVENESAPFVPAEILEISENVEFSEEDLIESLNSGERPTVLIVEDNPDVRLFLSRELRTAYNILTADQGKDGLAMALERSPDLIITDMMMPEMDGLELCSTLKSNPETSHIPVVMLTAKASDEFRLKGIREGADDYFAKPVNIDILKARIDTLFESRRLLRERFSNQVVIQPKEIAVTSADEAFLENAIRIMEDNMQEESFGVEEFANKIAMGRTSLYRKMKAVVGLSPHEFIKSMRLKRAAQLLSSGKMNVSETYAQVGISTISYFSKIFREEYGCTPSEYRQNAAQAKPPAQ